MKILSIGNSFSQDAQRYLHALGEANGLSVKAVNLYISGCPLKTHYYNLLDNNKAYDFEFNGVPTGIYVTLKETLMSDEWDYITLQQASPDSTSYATYQPYLNALVAYVKKYCPHSKLLIHQTWAYEPDSDRLCKVQGYPTHEAMLADIVAAYAEAAKEIGADGLLPCGQVMGRLLELGVPRIHRDPIHASRGTGRYALALTWLTWINGWDPEQTAVCNFDEPIPEEEIAAVKRAVKEILKTR